MRSALKEQDKFWRLLQEYGIGGHLLLTIKSHNSQPELCVRVNGKQSKSFHVSVGLRFFTYPFHNLQELDDKLTQTD